MPGKTLVPLTVNLARQEGVEYRSVLLSVSSTQIRLSTTDAGPKVLRFWQHEEYEFWVDVTAAGVPSLILALLKEKYQGNLSAVDEFRSFCKENNVPHEFMTWSS